MSRSTKNAQRLPDPEVKMANEGAFDILLIGFNEELTQLVGPLFADSKIKKISTAEDLEGFLENFELAPGTTVFVSNHLTGMTHYEVGQALSSYFLGLQLVYLTLQRDSFEIETLKKNGFTESFLLPLDRRLLDETVHEVLQSKTGGGTRRYKAVKLVDMSPGEDLPFSVRTYLPLNNKYVILNASGKLSEKKHSLLKERGTNSVFIDTDEVDKFYEYAAEKLIAAGESSNDAVSATEKAERLQSSIRGLFRSILDASDTGGDFRVGKDLLDQSKKIVSSYVNKKTGLDVKKTLRSVLGEGRDSYSHAQVVSTLACLMSMGTGVGEPEDLAIAGLFHDIGIYGIGEDISIFELDKLSAEQLAIYKQHPRLSLNLLKEKKITVTPKIADIIEKHHERTDGKGFPAGLPAHKVPFEAQLLGYADAFEYLSRPRPGQLQLSPLEIHTKLSESLGLSPELLIKLRNFLKSSMAAEANPAIA